MIRGYYDAVGPVELPWRDLVQTENPMPSNILRIRKLTLLALMLATLASTGCVYRASISQGNLIKQDDLDQVEIGMTRSQVRFLLGTPMIDDPFHADRWDYAYYLKIGRQGATFTRWVSILFEDGVVSEVLKDQDLNPGL